MEDRSALLSFKSALAARNIRGSAKSGCFVRSCWADPGVAGGTEGATVLLNQNVLCTGPEVQC